MSDLRQLPVPDGEAAIRVRFWGVRGSVPAPGPQTARYGGNTSCVTLEAPDTELIVLDAGTGIRHLGLALLRAKRLPLTAHLFLSHTHWDHIQGFPFFAPAFIPGNRLIIYGGRGGEQDLADALEGQMLHRYFPVRLSDLGADILFRDLTATAHAFAGGTVTRAPTRHPGETWAYRFELAGRAIVYATDTEAAGKYPELVLDPQILELARDADVLIHDAQYTDEEFGSKIGWGHSPLSYAVKLALAARVERLVLFHHDPTHDDDQIDAMLRAARTMAAGTALQIEAATEGLELALPARAAPARAVPLPAPESSAPRRQATAVAAVSRAATNNGHRPAPAAPAAPGSGTLSLDERLRILRRMPMFRLLRPDELQPLAEASDTVVFAPGEALVQQGEVGEHVFVIVDGRVEVLSRHERQGVTTEVAVSVLTEGEMVGELALVDGRPRSATCIAQVRTVCLRLGRRGFVGAAQQHWSVAQGLLAVLAERLRRSDHRMGDLVLDPVTGVYNGRSLTDAYEREVARARRVAAREQTPVAPPLTVLVCDVDRMQTINNAHGTKVGDEVLRAAARTLAATSRSVDVVARFGADGFAVLLPETGTEGAQTVAERVRRRLAEQPPGPVPFALRFGVAAVDLRQPPPLGDLLTNTLHALRG